MAAQNKPDVGTILSSLGKDELIRIILDLSETHSDIEKSLLFKYASDSDVVAVSRKLIREYINKAKRHGFIEYRNVFYALSGANMTLDKARDKVASNDVETAVSLSILVLSIVVDMLQYSDDSGGHVGFVIKESLDIIEEVVSANINKLDKTQQKKVFNAIFKEALNKRYDGWDDWRFDLLRTCIHFSVNNSDFRRKIEQELQNMLENISGSAWNREWIMTDIKLLQLEIHERSGEHEEAEQLIMENIALSQFREKAIIRLLENEDFNEVVRLCEDGIKVNKRYGGLVKKWKEFMLEAYEGLGDIAKQKALMFDLLYHDDFDYYHKLKELYPQNEWDDVLQEILGSYNNEDTHFPDAYLKILKEERLSNKLLEYCKAHLYSIENLYPYLVDDYFHEVNQLFRKFIGRSAEEASNRKEYRSVCRLIKTYKDACGDLHAQKIISELKETNKRRPAFIDELGKIK